MTILNLETIVVISAADTLTLATGVTGANINLGAGTDTLVLADEILTNALDRPLHDPRHDAGVIVARKLREAANALTDAADDFILRAGDHLDAA